MIIPTLEDVLEEQNDLNALCADRELKTKEIFSGNAFYGNDRIIKEFAGLPDKYPLKFIIPHGVVFSRSYIWKEELKNKLPSVMCYQENRIDTYKMRMGRSQNVFRGAAPYTYIPELIGNDKKPKRSGTIFFPAHSTHHLTCEMDYELLAEKLIRLDAIYQPVTVCIYWRDYNLGMSKIFEKKGLCVVSAGHIFDPHFLFRFYHLCSLHEYSACNQIGTHMFYAQYAGCKHFFIDSGIRIYKGEKNVIERDINSDAFEYQEKYSTLFSSPDKAMLEKKILLESYLSISFKKSRMALRVLLITTEFRSLLQNLSKNSLLLRIMNKFNIVRK